MSGLYPFGWKEIANSWRRGPCLFPFNLERAKLGLNAWQDNEQSGVEIQDEKARALPDKMVWLAPIQGPAESPNRCRQKSTVHSPAGARAQRKMKREHVDMKEHSHYDYNGEKCRSTRKRASEVCKAPRSAVLARENLRRGKRLPHISNSFQGWGKSSGHLVSLGQEEEEESLALICLLFSSA